MEIKTTGRKVTLKPAFMELTEKRLAKLSRFFTDSAVAAITVTVEKERHTVELTVRDKDLVVRSEKIAPKMEDALKEAVENVEKQVVKNHRKLDAKLRKGARETIDLEYPAPAALFAGEEQEPLIAREKALELHPMTTEEAILQMDLTDHDFFMFLNEKSGDVNVVYKRKGGRYGLLYPEK